ncbi:MAG: DNA/RNA helicase, partial [Firmicutes bacterium HGW-Firmicutes-21]
MSQTNFSDIALSEEAKRAISEMGYDDATLIQSQSIPLILEGHDVIGRSQTGSGKTAAFGLPAIEIIDSTVNPKTVQVLILCPTRELAVQACSEIRKFAKYKNGINVVPIYGG